MKSLNDIVAHLNGTWLNNAFSDSRFRGVSLHGIGSQIPVNGNDGLTYTIAIFDNKGKVVTDFAGWNETGGSVQLYHRVLGSSRKTDSSRGSDTWGHEMQPLSRTMEMTCLVFFDKKQVRLDADEMELLLMSTMPNEMTTEQIGSGYGSVQFLHGGSLFNSQYLFKREFNIDNYTMEPEIVLFEFKYTIECSYQADCVKVLCCPTP